MLKKWFVKFNLILIVAAAVFCSGCSVNGLLGQAQVQREPTGQLVVASSLGETLTLALVQDFANRTGIQVQVEALPPEQLPQRLERLAGDRADLWLGGTPEEYFLAVQRSLLANYQAEENWRLPWQQTDRQGRWTPLFTDRLAFLGNRERLGQLELVMPTAWEDLLAPVLHKEIILERPDNGGATFAMITSLWQLRGQDTALSYAGRLRTQAPQYVSEAAEAARLVYEGKKAVTVLPLSYALALQEENPTLQAEEVKNGNADLLQGVAVLRSGPDQREAQAFIDYLLSPAGTDLLASLDPYKKYLVRSGEQEPKPREEQQLPNNDLGWMARERQAIITAWLNAY